MPPVPSAGPMPGSDGPSQLAPGTMRRALRHVGSASTPRDRRRAREPRAHPPDVPPAPARAPERGRPWPSCAAGPRRAGRARCGCATTSSGTAPPSRPSVRWGWRPPPPAGPPSGRASCNCPCATRRRWPRRPPPSPTCRGAGSCSASASAPTPVSTTPPGVDFAGRGRRLDEGIDTLRRSWAVSPGQRYAQLPAVGPVPVWIGGSSEAALRRAARRGDGWIPLFVPPRRLRGRPRPTRQGGRAGRARSRHGGARHGGIRVGGRPGAAERRTLVDGFALRPPGTLLRETPGGRRRPAVRPALARFAEAGAQHVAVFVTSDDPLVQFEDLAGEFAGLVASRSARPPRPGRDERGGAGPPAPRRAVRSGSARWCRPHAGHRSKTRFGGEVVMRQDVSIVGIGMTPMDRRDLTPDVMAGQAVRAALDDAGLSPGDVGLVIAANALGGRLCDQGCIRGQSWLRHVDLGHHRCRQRGQLLCRRLFGDAPRRAGRPGGTVSGARRGRREDVDRPPGRDHRRDRGRVALRRAGRVARPPRQRRRQRAHGPQRHLGPPSDRGAGHDSAPDRGGGGQSPPVPGRATPWPSSSLR